MCVRMRRSGVLETPFLEVNVPVPSRQEVRGTRARPRQIDAITR
jgi:hypothetical protein